MSTTVHWQHAIQLQRSRSGRSRVSMTHSLTDSPWCICRKNTFQLTSPLCSGKDVWLWNSTLLPSERALVWSRMNYANLSLVIYGNPLFTLDQQCSWLIPQTDWDRHRLSSLLPKIFWVKATVYSWTFDIPLLHCFVNCMQITPTQ